MTEYEILLETLELRTGLSQRVLKTVFEEAETQGWQLKPKRSPELPNIPLDACGVKDIGFTAHVLGGK